MKLFALYAEETKRRHWVVRWLRYMGYFIVIGSIISAVAFSGNTLTPIFQQMFHDQSNWIAILVLVLGALFGFVGGLGLSLPLWGMALMIDDIHAIRLQTAAYVTNESEYHEMH